MQVTKVCLILGTLGMVGLLNTASASAKVETYNVTLTYVLEPTEKLPSGLHNLAILDDGIKVDVTDDEARAKKWGKICADMMEQMILDSKKKFGTELTLVKRRETSKVAAEQDLKNSGQTTGGAEAQNAKLADVQALIISQLNIRIEVNKSKKSTFDVTSLYGGGGWRSGFGGGSITPREAEAVSREMTLQCKFSMLDAATSKAFFEYAPKPFRKHDSKKPSPVFGRSAGEADLDPVDGYIGELVEEGTREFVSTFAPLQVEYTYELKSASSSQSAAGVRALRADDYDSAMQSFKAAVEKDPKDHASVFAMGVTSELMHDWERALKYYRQAASMAKVDKRDMEMYLAAKERVAAHKDRIRKSDKKP